MLLFLFPIGCLVAKGLYIIIISLIISGKMLICMHFLRDFSPFPLAIRQKQPFPEIL